MGSFKLRLVISFMLLALLPLVGATWAFSQMAVRSETGAVDSRLSTAVRVAQAEFGEKVEVDAARTARSLARATRVQRAFATHNRSALVRTARELEHTAFYSTSGELLGGAPPPLLAPRRAVNVLSGNERIGRVVVYVPFDAELVADLERRAGLEEGERILFAAGSQVLAPRNLGRTLELEDSGPRYGTVGGVSVRAVAAELVVGGEDGETEATSRAPVMLVALTRKAVIDAAADDLQRRFLLIALVAMAAVGSLAYALGRPMVRSLRELADAAGAVARGQFERRVPVRGSDELAEVARTFNDMAAQLEQRIAELAAERERAHDTIARFGDALAVTHDPLALLRVIVASTVEATGAAGGRLLVRGEEIARDGEPDEGGRPLAIPLGSESESAELHLTPAGADFTDESRELAHWLGAQATIALENARLHRLVERQANTDGLTELPNRRHFEDAMDAEISRAERFGGGVALIFADLDDFKQVNDRYGHQAGDHVLKTFADILRATVREIDVAARYGGEEFAVLLPGTGLDGAHRLAERLRRALASRPMATQSNTLIAVTASFGVAAYPDARTPAALFAAADEALYRAKRAGKNCVVAADGDPLVRARD